jgi:hypothetical protein
MLLPGRMRSAGARGGFLGAGELEAVPRGGVRRNTPRHGRERRLTPAKSP